jgi:hypothetical protein
LAQSVFSSSAPFTWRAALITSFTVLGSCCVLVPLFIAAFRWRVRLGRRQGLASVVPLPPIVVAEREVAREAVRRPGTQQLLHESSGPRLGGVDSYAGTSAKPAAGGGAALAPAAAPAELPAAAPGRPSDPFLTLPPSMLWSTKTTLPWEDADGAQSRRRGGGGDGGGERGAHRRAPPTASLADSVLQLLRGGSRELTSFSQIM